MLLTMILTLKDYDYIIINKNLVCFKQIGTIILDSKKLFTLV